MSECVFCGATDAPEAGIIVGLTGHSQDSVCTICHAQRLQDETSLSERESQVAAHKQITGASNATIAERLGIEKSTVDEYYRRFREKVETAARTCDALGEFL